MNNTDVLNEYFIWEEKSLTDPNQNLLKNAEQDKCVTITETKNDLTPKDWRDITDPKLKEKMRKKTYRDANKDKIKDYYNKNREKILNRTKIYNRLNRKKINQRHRHRMKNDVLYKLRTALRLRSTAAIKGNYKSGSAVRDLGCSIGDFKLYLESKFQPGMTWENHTQYGWHIDHIKPLSSFDLTDRKQFLEACHYTNLQPLWAKDNLSKGSNWAQKKTVPDCSRTVFTMNIPT